VQRNRSQGKAKTVFTTSAKKHPGALPNVRKMRKVPLAFPAEKRTFFSGLEGSDLALEQGNRPGNQEGRGQRQNRSGRRGGVSESKRRRKKTSKKGGSEREMRKVYPLNGGRLRPFAMEIQS